MKHCVSISAIVFLVLISKNSFAQTSAYPKERMFDDAQTVSSGYEVKILEGAKVKRIGSQVIPEAPEESLARQLADVQKRLETAEKTLTEMKNEPADKQGETTEDQKADKASLKELGNAYQKLNQDFLSLTNSLTQRMVQIETTLAGIQATQNALRTDLTGFQQEQKALEEKLDALKKTSPAAVDKSVSAVFPVTTPPQK